MESLIENKPMLISLFIALVGVIVLPMGAFADVLHLVPLDYDVSLRKNKLIYTLNYYFLLNFNWFLDLSGLELENKL